MRLLTEDVDKLLTDLNIDAPPPLPAIAAPTHTQLRRRTHPTGAADASGTLPGVTAGAGPGVTFGGVSGVGTGTGTLAGAGGGTGTWDGVGTGAGTETWARAGTLAGPGDTLQEATLPNNTGPSFGETLTPGMQE